MPAPNQDLAGGIRTAGPLLALLGVTSIWGSTFVLVKDAIGRMPAVDFLAWRFAIATLAMIAVRPSAVRALSRVDVRRAALVGVTLGAGYLFQTIGLERTPATVSGFITGLFVVFTPLCGAALLRQRIPPMVWVAVVVAAVGLALISLRGFSIGTGELLTVGCALAFALQIVGLAEWATPANAVGMATVQLAVTTVMCAVAAAPVEHLRPPPDAGVWGAILLTALAATALAFFVQTWAQAHLEQNRAAVVMTMEPVFAGLFGVSVGGDRLTARIVLGALCVLAAMWLTELGPRPPVDAATQTHV